MSITTILPSFGPPAPVAIDPVKSTVTVVDNDAPASVQPLPPGWNDADTDNATEGGLTTRQLASHVVPSGQYVPNIGNANEDPNAIINRQVSTSGTAAAREAAGIWGHGTMKVVEGIEPAIREGDKLGGDYFTTYQRINPASEQMTPAQIADPAAQAAAQRGATSNSRDAVQAAQYQAWYNAQIGRSS